MLRFCLGKRRAPYQININQIGLQFGGFLQHMLETCQNALLNRLLPLLFIVSSNFSLIPKSKKIRTSELAFIFNFTILGFFFPPKRLTIFLGNFNLKSSKDKEEQNQNQNSPCFPFSNFFSSFCKGCFSQNNFPAGLEQDPG